MHRRHLLRGVLGIGTLGACAGLRARVGTDGAAAVTSQVSKQWRSGTVSRIAFASCIDQTKPQRIWDAVQADRPDLLIFGGDNVYASEQPWSVEQLRGAYARQATVTGFARLRREVPHLAIWDDHDYGLNDGGEEFAFKSQAKAEFLSFWNIPDDDPRRSRDGLYHSQTMGPDGQRVQVILLDNRWFRSRWKPTDRPNAPGRERYIADTDPAKTMLGQAQWQWLERCLAEPADLRIIVSSIQVVANGHGWECWANFPHERDRLYNLIGKARAESVVFLSGDRHIGAIYRQVEGAPYPLHELTSSGITHTWREVNEPGPNRLALVTDLHYGVVDIDWSSGAVELSIRDISGRIRGAHRFLLNELRINT